MPRLSDIEVALTAEDKTGSAFSSVTGKLGALGKVAGTAAGAAALVGGAFIAAAKTAIDFASSIQDAAAAAGLSVETYQALRNEAGLAGVRQEEFASAMSRATKVIGDAASGNKAAAETFAKLGIGVRTASGEVRPTEDIIRDLSDRIAEMGSQAEKSSAAAAIFGRSAGPALVPMLEQGSKGIDSFIASGKEMGLVLSEELIRKGDDAGDKLDILSNTLQTTFAGALLEVAPLVSEMATDLAEAAVAASDWWQAIRGTDMGQKRINRLAEEIRSTTRAIEHIQQADALTAYMEGGEDKVTSLRAELKRLNEDLVRTAQGFTPSGDAPPRTTGVAGKTAEQLAAEKALEEERKRLARDRAAAEKAALRDVSDFEGAEQLRSLMATEQYYAELGQKRDEFVSEGLESLRQAGEAAVDEGGAMALANATAGIEAYEAIEARGVEAAGRLSDAFERVLFAGFRDGTDGMLDAFKAVLAEMGAELLRSQLRDGLASIFGEALGNNSKGSSSGWIAAVADLFGSAGGGKGADLSKLKGGAMGGSFIVPGTASGDNVVPLFRANAGEKVTITPPGGGGASAGGGITINQTIYSPGSSAGDMARLKQAAKEGADEAVARIVDMRSRGKL